MTGRHAGAVMHSSAMGVDKLALKAAWFYRRPGCIVTARSRVAGLCVSCGRKGRPCYGDTAEMSESEKKRAGHMTVGDITTSHMAAVLLRMAPLLPARPRSLFI
jgi:hypothetical protein